MTAKYDNFFTPVSSSKQTTDQYDDFFEPIPEGSRLKSLGGALAKGIIKGAQSISPLPKFGPVSEQLGMNVTEQMLPSEDKLPEQLIERAGKLGTFAIGGEGSVASKLGRAALGSVFGQTTKELGGGQMAQDIAELSSMGLPDLTKSIPAKKAQERVINFLRGRGFTENEIAPLLQSPKKLSRYAKFASKGEKTNKLMRDTYGKFDNVYSSIREKGENLPGLPSNHIDNFLDTFQKQLDKIPKFYKRQIKEEIDDLMNSPMKFNDFLDFDQAVNARIKGVQGGRSILGTLKEATSQAKKAVNPELAEELNLANELYSKRADVSKHLSTKEIDDLIDVGEAGTILAGIADQNLGLIRTAIGTIGGRILAREILINPKLQNISTRMRESIKKNKLQTARKLYEIFRKEAIKTNEDLKESLPDFDLNPSNNKKQTQGKTHLKSQS